MSVLYVLGELHEYRSVDSGRKKYLDKCVVPARLFVKIGAPVILRRTLSDHLVNGRQGIVTTLSNNSVTVKFENEISVTLKSVTFDMHEFSKKVATRIQLPLTLAFALTVHKAQGLTFDKHVLIDATDMNQPGQLSVAVSRARCKDKLSIINLDRCTPKQHPTFILNLYAGIPMLSDKSCCKQEIGDPDFTSVATSSYTEGNLHINLNLHPLNAKFCF